MRRGGDRALIEAKLAPYGLSLDFAQSDLSPDEVEAFNASALEPVMGLLVEQVGVCAGSGKLQFIAGNPVDQQPVRLDVGITKANP